MNVRLTLEELHVIEDALAYYWNAIEDRNTAVLAGASSAPGPEGDPIEVRRIERWVGRYISREER